MRRSLLRWLTATALLSAACTTGEGHPGAGDAAAKSTAAHEQRLLGQYVGAFQAMASAASPELFPEAMAELATSARRLRAEDKLSDAFYGRFEELVDVSSTLTQAHDSPAAEANLNRKLERFAKRVKGPDAPSVTDASLAAVSELFVEEVINLHLITEPNLSRQAARKLYFEPLR